MLNTSEVLLIILMFQQSGFINFKWYYENEVCGMYRSYFTTLPSYNRFVELIPGVLPLLLRLLNYQLYLSRHYSNEIEYIDSTKMQVCHNKLQLCHTRHRSIANLVVHILAVVTGYQLFGNKPKINMNHLLDNFA